jgi:serine protease AprX
VIRSINWIVANKATSKIRVLNCSFSAPVHSWYWQDPLNQAIMKAWQAGIVVVASAGNGGPKPMTIGISGNVPYVITVGAMTDYYTPNNSADDRLASFSAAGPTFEGFPKPDVVAPGGHVYSTMEAGTQVIAGQHPELATSNDRIFMMSGTSQSAAVVSGIAALMPQANPSLTPDDVKCGLMATADVAWSGSSTPYSVFQQGAGLVRAYDAVRIPYAHCANNGLNIAMDLAGTRHFAGSATQDASGNFILMDQTGNGTTWSGGYSKASGLPLEHRLSLVQRLPLVQRPRRALLHQLLGAPGVGDTSHERHQDEESWDMAAALAVAGVVALATFEVLRYHERRLPKRFRSSCRPGRWPRPSR